MALHMRSACPMQRMVRPIQTRPCTPASRVVRCSATDGNKRVIKGKCFVTKDPDEYEKLGSYALIGLPDDLYPERYIQDGSMKTEYPIVIAGDNFGCGSSREHAPVAMGASGTKVVVAESYARIFFRNCVATGELYPVETETRLCDELTTGMEVEVDMDNDELRVPSSGKVYRLKPLGEAGPVIDAGGIFEYARQQGMIKTKAAA